MKNGWQRFPYTGLLHGVIVTFVIDRFTKAFALTWLAPYQPPRVFVPELLQFRLVLNTRIAFFFEPPVWLVVASLMAILVLLVFFIAGVYKRGHVKQAQALGIIVAAAASNVVDRLWYGGVVDFIEVPWWSVFNLADVAIIFGVCKYAWFSRYAPLEKNTAEE